MATTRVLSASLQGKYKMNREGMKPGKYILPETGNTEWDFTTMDERTADTLIAKTGDKYLTKLSKAEKVEDKK